MDILTVPEEQQQTTWLKIELAVNRVANLC